MSICIGNRHKEHIYSCFPRIWEQYSCSWVRERALALHMLRAPWSVERIQIDPRIQTVSAVGSFMKWPKSDIGVVPPPWMCNGRTSISWLWTRQDPVGILEAWSEASQLPQAEMCWTHLPIRGWIQGWWWSSMHWHHRKFLQGCSSLQIRCQWQGLLCQGGGLGLLLGHV